MKQRISHREVQERDIGMIWTRDRRNETNNTSEEIPLDMVPRTRRRRGRPKQRWMDFVNRHMTAIGTTKQEVHDNENILAIDQSPLHYQRQVGLQSNVNFITP